MSSSIIIIICPTYLSVLSGTTGKGRPQKGSGTDEDIYGGVDDGAEGVYDNAGGQRGMKFSDEGVYENPRSTGECTGKPV